MRQSIAIVGLCVSWSACVFAAEDQPRKQIALPDEAKAEVISLDFQGGFTPPRLKKSPTLSVLRDGTVLIPDNYGQSQDVKTQMTEKELQDLLHFIIETNKFFEIDAKKIQAQVMKAEQPKKDKQGNLTISIAPRVADAPNTVIMVETKDRDHEVTWYALSMAAGQHKEIAALQQLRAIEQRLQRVMTVAHAGGTERVAEVLNLVNERVQQEYPGAQKLSQDHLLSASLRPDGSRSCFWQWIQQGPDGTAASARYVTVNMQQPATGEPTFMINVKLK